MSKSHFLNIAPALMTEAKDPIESISQLLDNQINRKGGLIWNYYFEPEAAREVLKLLVQANVQPELIQKVFYTLGVRVSANVRAYRVQGLNTSQRLPSWILPVLVIVEIMIFAALFEYVFSPVLRRLFG
jgi:hypothetical protein